VETSSDEAPDIAAELHASDLFDQLVDAGCGLIARGLPAIPVNGKRPCNAAGNPARKWQSAKCDLKRLIRGLRGAIDPKPHWKTRKVPESEPGIGLRMGPGSVIDVETDSPDERTAVRHLLRGCRKPKTVSYKSKRGQHDLYRYDERLAALEKDVFTYQAPDGKSVKIRIGGQKAGAQSVIPPTPGRVWLPGRSFDEIEPAALPEVVIQRLLEQAAARPSRRKTPKSAVPKADTEKAPEKPSLSDWFRRDDGATDDLDGSSSSSSRSLSTVLHVLRATCESIQCASVEQLYRPDVVKGVNGAVDRCIVKQFRKRHDLVFDLVRHLQTIPGVGSLPKVWLNTPEGREWIDSFLWPWFQRSKDFIEHADYEDCVYDFIQGWDKVKHPHGETLSMLCQQSRTEPVPAAVIKRMGLYDGERIRRLVQLCIVQQRRMVDKPFPMASHEVAAALGQEFSQPSVSRKLRELCRLGILERTSEGKRGHAAEYIYLPAFENKATPCREVRELIAA